MRIVAIFACLCFLLIMGDASIHAGVQQTNCGYAIVHASSAKVSANSTVDTYPNATDPNQTKELAYIISDDVEDEDVSDFASSKDRLPARPHAVHTFLNSPPCLKQQDKCFKSRPFYFWPVTSKHILHQVFRIWYIRCISRYRHALACLMDVFAY